MLQRKIITNDTGITGITDTMDVNNYILLDLDFNYVQAFSGIFKNLWIRCSNIHASTTAITMRITTDQAGDNILSTNTASAISFGLTSSTSGTAAWLLDITWISRIEKVYVFLEADHGTFDFEEAILTYEVDR